MILIRKLKVACGKNYRKRILNSNITRIDITFDSDGYFVSDVMFNLDKSSYFKTFIGIDGEFETRISGANRSRRIQAYDKTAEQIKSAISHVDINAVNTRIEMTVRPHNIKGIKGLKIKCLDEVKPIYSGLKIYNSSKLKFLLGENSSDWNIAHYFGVSALRRSKSNTERVKLSRLLKSCCLDVDESKFNEIIKKELSKICDKFTPQLRA